MTPSAIEPCRSNPDPNLPPPYGQSASFVLQRIGSSKTPNQNVPRSHGGSAYRKHQPSSPGAHPGQYRSNRIHKPSYLLPALNLGHQVANSGITKNFKATL